MDGHVGLETFETTDLTDTIITSLMDRVTMTVDKGFDNGAPALTQSRVTARLRDGRTFSQQAAGARGYPANPASDAELDEKFLSCAERALSKASSRRALESLRRIAESTDIRAVARQLVS